MGRRLKIDDYVLLPMGSSAAPENGILYAEITGTCMLEKCNKFNASVSKRRPGWVVKVFTSDDSQELILEIPKSYPLIQYCSTELENELGLRPKELLGMYVGRGLLDQKGDDYINYGQVNSVSVRENVAYCTVVFRLLPDGSAITNMEFRADELIEFEVTLLQFTMGMGVGTIFKNADRRVGTFRTILEHMQLSDDHARWIKEFGSFGVARPNQTVLDPFLEPVEISLSKILSNWPALARYVPEVKPPALVKDLRVAFNVDDEGFGECISGNPVTPVRAADSLQSKNQRRQEYRNTAVSQVLPLPFEHPQRAAVKLPVEEQRQGLSVEVQRESLERLQVSPGGYASSSPSSSYGSNYAKHGYHPTHAQLQKHKITFRDGAYGKSSSLEEATVGIDEVLGEELHHSVKNGEAYIRTYCIMMGDLTLVPYGMWRNGTLAVNNYEESYMPVKWTKLPELKAVEVVELDEFWSLYHSMEEAAARYYVNSYCLLLARTRTNLLAAFMVVGGRPGFIRMRVSVRKNVIHVLVAYLRRIVSKFVMEVLATGADAMEWMNREAGVNAPAYEQHVRALLTNIQLSELATRSMNSHGNGHGDRGGGGDRSAKEDGEWTSRMPKNIRDSIPKADGTGICLLSYTRQGCKKQGDGCVFHHKKAGSPSCPPALQEWIAKTYGTYVGP